MKRSSALQRNPAAHRNGNKPHDSRDQTHATSSVTTLTRTESSDEDKCQSNDKSARSAGTKSSMGINVAIVTTLLSFCSILAGASIVLEISNKGDSSGVVRHHDHPADLTNASATFSSLTNTTVHHLNILLSQHNLDKTSFHQSNHHQGGDNHQSQQYFKSIAKHRTNTGQGGLSLNGNPYLILHLGPPKTGTTTIQQELASLQQVLSNDKYRYIPNVNENIYARKHGGIAKLLDYSCHQALSNLRQNQYQNENRTDARFFSILKRKLRSMPCWQAALEKLDSYRRSNTSLILSSEIVSVRDINSFVVNETALQLEERQQQQQQHQRPKRRAGRPKTIKSNIDWPSLDLMIGDQWNIIILLGYRRYVEWIPSSKQQQERWNPAKWKLNKWPLVGGKKLKPLFPTVISSSFYPPGNSPTSAELIPYRYTKQLIEMIQQVQLVDGTMDTPFIQDDENTQERSITSTENNPKRRTISVRLLNMHSPGTLLTKFVCDLIPFAHVTCAHAHALDEERRRATQQQRQTNATTLDNVEHKSNPTQMKLIWYDVLATDAAEKALFDASVISRREMTLAMQKYYEQNIVHGNETDPNDDDDQDAFVFACPSKMELEQFLNISIKLEYEMLPDFARSEWGSTRHEQDFWNAARLTKKFCWIDTNATLERDIWKRYFETSAWALYSDPTNENYL